MTDKNYYVELPGTGEKKTYTAEQYGRIKDWLNQNHPDAVVTESEAAPAPAQQAKPADDATYQVRLPQTGETKEYTAEQYGKIKDWLGKNHPDAEVSRKEAAKRRAALEAQQQAVPVQQPEGYQQQDFSGGLQRSMQQFGVDLSGQQGNGTMEAMDESLRRGNERRARIDAIQREKAAAEEKEASGAPKTYHNITFMDAAGQQQERFLTDLELARMKEADPDLQITDNGTYEDADGKVTEQIAKRREAFDRMFAHPDEDLDSMYYVTDGMTPTRKITAEEYLANKDKYAPTKDRTVEREMYYNGKPLEKYDVSVFENEANKEALVLFQEENADFVAEYERRLEEANAGGRSAAAAEQRQWLKDNAQKYRDIKDQEQQLVERMQSNPEYSRVSDAIREQASSLAKQASKRAFQLQTVMNMDAGDEASHHNFLENVKSLTGARTDQEAEIAARDLVQEKGLMSAASRMSNDALRAINAPSTKDNGFLAFLKGHGDTFTDADFWTRGLTEIATNYNLSGVLEKLQKKIHNLDLQTISDPARIDKYLTEPERQLLQSYVLLSTAQAQRAYDVNNMYQAGKTSAESLGFMAEFILTGGIGKAVAEKTTKAAFTKYLRHLVGEKAAGASIGARAFAAKTAESIATPIVKTAAMMGAMPGTYKTYWENRVTPDAETGFFPTRSEDFWKTALTTVRDQGLEVWSEQSLEPILGVLGIGVRGALKGTGKFTRKDLMSASLADIAGIAKNSDVIRILREAGFNGYLEEMGEEVVGAAVRQIWDKDSWSEFWDPDNVAQMAVAFAPMSLFGGGASMVNYEKTKQRYEQSLPWIRQQLAGQGLTPEQIEEKLSLEGRTMADVGKGISSILSDAVRGREDLTDEDYRNILDFASATAQKRIVDEIEYEQKVKQRDAMKHMITQQLGGKKFISTRRQDVGEVVVERDSDAEREQKIRQIKDSLVVGSALNVGGQQGRVSSVGADHVVVMFDSPVTVNGETGTSFELSLEEAGRALPQPIDASPRTDGVTQMDFDYVHTIRMKDGTVRYVIDDATARGAAGEDSDVMTIDREGNVRFMDRASIEDESNEDIDFSSKDTHRWSTTAYLDKMVEDYRAAQEQQRRDAIQAQKDGDVRGALYAGRSDLRIEYNGVMTDGIVLGTVGDRIAVQPVGEDGQPITNADGTPYYEVKTLQECGRALGMDVQVQTEDEAIRERAMQAVIDEADCFRANNRGPAILQHNGQDYTFVRVKPTFTDRDTALDVVVVDATGMTTVLTDVTMEEIRAMQPISEEKAAQQAEAAQQAAAAQQETEYARAVKAVTREDGSVDGSQLLQDNPGAFARWSDSSRGKEATDALINSNILKAQQELQAAQTAVDTETDPNRQEELIAERDRRAARLQTLVDLQMSRTPQDPAAAGALSQQDAANAVLSLMQRGLSIQEVASLADSEAVEAVKRQAAVVKPKISADIEGYKQQMQQYDAAIDAEQKKIDYWQSVKNAIDAAALQQKASNVQAFVDSIRGDMPAQAVTMDNVVEVMQADGCPAEAIARVSVELEEVEFQRSIGNNVECSGFHSNGKVYIFAESVKDEADVEVTFRHERQHEFNAIDGSAVNAVLGTGISREDLALLVHNLCGNDQYANDDSRTLADELIAFGLEDAKETINIDRLRKAGIADEIINILENEYRQQRADGYNLQARRARALQSQSSQEPGGHDVQNQAGRAGQVDSGQPGADEGSRVEAESREGQPAAEQPAEQVEPEPAEGEISDELKQELQDRDLVFDGDAGIVTDTAQAQLKQESGYQTPNERAEEDQALFSIRTLGPWSENYRQYPGSEERVIVVVNAWGERAAADELVSGVISQGNYEYRGKKKVNGSFAGPLRTNVEYVVTFDMDTTCPRTFQYLNYATKIERQIGRPLTQRESVQLIEMMRAYGQQIPCVYCYAENKRQALKQYFTDFMTARTGVLSAKNDKEALKVMYGRKAYADKKSNNPKEVLTEAAEKVFRQWRTNPESIYNPSLKTLWKNFSYARNSVLSDLDLMLSEGRIKVEDKDSAILKALAKDLRVNNAKALKVLAEFVAEWHWDAIENRPHKDFQELDEDDFDAYEQDLSVWRDMTAYAKSASSAKSVLKYIPYTDELKYLSQEDRDYINGMGGVRMHSTNDFRLDYVLDYFQFIADMAANRMFGHTYTKSPEFVRIFGNTGYKINMSIAAYEDADGNIRMNEEEGFNWDVAKELREQFPNAGVMLMATSNNQIQMALDSDWIDMFIPFHNSGLPNEIWKDMRLWTNYQSVQNEAFYDADAMTEALEARGVEVPRKIKSKDLEDLFVKECGIKRIYVKSGKKKGDRVRPHFLPGPTMVEGEVVPGHNNDLQTYLDLCRQYGVRPRFYGTKVKDADGNTIDISEHPNYIKCIKETARIDTPQQAVRFNLDEPSEALGGRSPMEYAFEALKNQIWSEQQQMGGAIQTIYDSAEKDIMGIIPQFIDKIVGYKERTGKELPLDYLTPDARDWYLTQRRALEQAYQNVEEIPYHPNAYDEEGRVIPKRKEYVIPLNKIEKINAGQKQAGDQSVTEADLQPALNFRTVYHGSGAKFDKFSTDFMSTGEGNQAYGWGTYVTTNEETGRKYAEIADTRSSEREYYESKIREYQEMMRTASDNVKRGLENQIKDLQATLDAMPATERSLYTVEIPDDNGENYLHWDKPITRAQSRKIIDGIKAQVGDRLIEEYGDEKSVDYELKSALGYGTYGSHVEGALDYFFGNETNYATGENPGAERNSKFLNSLGIVGMEIPIDRNGGRRYEGSNFVIYNTDDAVIANRVSFRISNNNRQTIEKWVSRWAEEENRYGAFDSDEEMRGFVQQAMQFVEDTFQDATEQLAWAKWFSNGAINYGEEDVPKVKQAVKVARNHKADPLRYGSPMEIINQWPEQIKDSAIDPDTVSTLHRAQEVPGTDIVIYDVDESEESRRNMREIINTHFGKKSSPWCLLQGDENGVLTPASKDYWNRYGAYPKQVAFKGGKLLAFCANNSTQVKWWDKQDRSHEGVPVIGKIPGDELGRSATLEYGPMTGEVTRMSDIHKGNKQNGEYTEWYQPSGQIIERSNWKNGVQHGVTEFYTTSGILSTRANFKEGKLDGLYEHFFNSDGAISGVETYRDGEMLTQKQYYHTGQLSREYESTYPGDGPVKSTRTTYSKDGVVTDRSIIDDSVYFIGSEGFMRNGTRTYVETSDGYMVYTRYTLGDIQYQIDARDMAGHRSTTYRATDEVLSGLMKQAIDKYQEAVDRNDLDDADDWRAIRGHLINVATNGRGATVVPQISEQKVMSLDEAYEKAKNGVNFRVTNDNQRIFVSNAEQAVNALNMPKATPEQWLKAIQGKGGLKAGEDKWLGLSEWLQSSDRKSITKEEVLQFINENSIRIEEVHYSENGRMTDEELSDFYYELPPKVEDFNDQINDEFRDLLDGGMEWREAYDTLAEKYGTSFEEAYDISEQTEGDDYLQWIYPDPLMVLAGYKTDSEVVSEDRAINSTRLTFTTGGLRNKREIALTVPTIKPWNKSDDVHFGDAGEGRAVAWIRFGETVIPNGELDNARSEFEAFENQMREKYGRVNVMDMTWEESRRWSELEQRETDAHTADGAKVLVIDEIQSKRHQEGRDKGYTTTGALEAAQQRLNEFIDKQKAKYGGDNYSWADNAPAEEVAEYDRLLNERNRLLKGIPDAPFEKNWHELAMKRMLRLAAEEGYDYVAWTTGEQQAERYSIGGLLDRAVVKIDDYDYEGKRWIDEREPRYIALHLNNANEGVVDLAVDKDGNVFSSNYGDYIGKSLSDIVGKEMSIKLMSTPIDGLDHSYSGDDLRIGGEGMKGFYDDILPRFMNKYGKKWGVKTQDIELPNVEEAGRVMHAVPVTDAMKQSIMEGQPMFRITAQQDAEYMQAVEAGDMEKAQRMVKAAAENAGYTAIGYHGTIGPVKRFGANRDGNIFFSKEREAADAYAQRNADEEGNMDANVIRAYLDLGKTAVVDAMENQFDEIGYKFTVSAPDGYEADFDNYPDALNEAVKHKNADIDTDITDTEGIGKIYRNKGYDSVIIENVYDLGNPDVYDGMQTDFILFNPRRIKSADPVTYDDAGNVIPLSQRFNPDSNDIRFRLAPNGKPSNLADEQYDAVRTPEFKSWFGDWENDPENASKVLDENGEPMVMYHGSRNGYGFTVFDTHNKLSDTKDNIGSHFGPKDTAAEFAGNDKMYAVFLNIRNPYNTWDFFADVWNNAYLEVIQELLIDAKKEETRKIAERIYDVYPQLRGKDLKKIVTYEDYADDEGLERTEVRISEKTGAAYQTRPDLKKNRDAMVAIIKDMMASEGYDGMVYENMYEGPHEMCYVALEPNQIKSATENNGNFSNDNPDIRFRIQNNYDGQWQGNFIYTGPKVEGETEKQILDYIMMSLNKYMPQYGMKGEDAIEEAIGYAYNEIGTGDAGTENWTDEIVDKFKPGMFTDVAETNRLEAAKKAKKARKQLIKEEAARKPVSPVTPEQDEEFRQAYEAGDEDKAMQMLKDTFKAMYPNTAVIDESGSPLVVYHGTPNLFNEFKGYMVSEDSEFGGGYYFTDSRKLAEEYTRPNGDNDWMVDSFIEDSPYLRSLAATQLGYAEAQRIAIREVFKDARVIPAFLNIVSPLKVDDMLALAEEFGEYEHVTDGLKANGYDGVIDNTFYARHKKDFKVELERGTTQYILNSIPSAAKNIKSAEPFTFDDKGELIPLSKRFDKSTNDIRFRTVEQRQSAYDQMNALRDELTQKYGTFNMGALSPEDQKRWSDAVDTWLDEAKDGRKAEVRFHISYPSPVTDRQKETVAANLKTFTDPKQLQQAKDAYINAESTIRAAYESEYGAKLARKAELEVRMKDLNASKGRAKQLGQDDVFRQLNAEFQEVKSELNSLSLSFPGFGEYSNQGQRLKIARDNAIMASGVLDNEQWKEVAVIPAFIPEIAEALMELGWNGDNNMLWATEYGFVSHRAAHHRDLADNEVIYDMQQNLYAPDVVGFSKTNPSTLLFIRKSANDSWYTTAISVNRHKNDGSLEFITTYKDKNDPTSELERVIYEPQKGAATANQIPGGFKVNGTKVSINSESTKDYGKNVDFRFIGEKGARRLDTIVERTPAGKVKISVNGELTQALALATQMEKDGREARDIKVATGWERGADGKWRYEQPDIHFTRPEEVFWTLDEAKTLGSFVSDPTLFKAYPELKDLKVYVRSLKSDTLGAVDGDGDIVLNSKHMSKVGNRYTILTMDVYETLLHELQHKIQALEGFARGDNSSMLANDLKEVAGGEAAYAFAQAFGSNTEKALLAQSPARLVSMLKLHLDSFTGEKREWADTLIQALDGISPADYRRLVHDAKTAIKQGRTKAGRDYRRSAGEVEARNVESRRSMTDAHRRNVLASETEDIAREEQIVRFRKVTDKAELDRLNSEPTIRMYCSMTVLNPEETDPTKIQLVPVKSAKVKGKMREPSMLGQWERSEEDKALAKQAKNGRLKFDLKDFENDAVAGVNYNPYFHLSDSMMNDQFTGAYDKPNTVVVEVEVPASELTSGYHADGAADSVGILPWHSGTVNAQLPEDQQRRVMLSRWRKPVRVVPDSEVAQFIARKLEGTDIAMPWNLVTPGVLAELDKLGVEIGDESVGLQKKIYRPRPMFRISGQAIASASVALSEVHGRIAEDGLSAVADESKLMMDIYREVPEGVRREMLERADIYSGRIAQGVAEYLSDAAAQQDPTEAQQLALSVAREALEREVSDVMPMNDARWMLYQNVHRDSQDLIDMARKTIVADRLGFSREWMDRKEAVAADIAFRTVNNAYNQSAADMYSTGLDWKAAVNEAHADMYTSVVKLVDAIATKTGRKMRDHENVLLALNQLSSKNFSEKDAYTRDFLNPMWDMIRAIATVMKGSSRQEAMDEIQRYVMLKHGLERNEAFAKRDALSFWRQWRDSMVNQVKEDDTKKQAHYDACKKIYDDAEAKYNAALAAPNAFTKKQIDELKAKYDQAKSSLDDARYILNHDEADVEADFQKHVRAIEKGTDAKYKELRLQDYSGLMAMYYDEPRLTRMQGESRESFRTRIRNARKPLYDVLADAEARAQSEVDNFENALDVDPIMVKEELKGLSKKLGITAGDNLAELLWDRINAATKETLRHQHESGMLSDASYDALVNMFKYYVPMRGFNEGTAEDMYTYMNSKGDSGFTAPVLRAKGRRSRAENPFGVIGAMAESAIQEDNKNLVKQKLYNFVSNRPNNGLAELSEAWYEDTGMTNPDGKRIYKKVYPHLTAGMSQAEMQKAWDDLAVAMEAKRSMGVKVFKGKVGLDLKKSIIFAEKDSEPEHFVRVKIFGEDYDIIINSNPRAAQAINGKLNFEVTDSEAKKFFMAWNRLQSALATSFNPNFVVTNFIRDVLYSQITALGDNGPKFWARYNKNLAKVLVNGRIFRLLADYNGGNLLSLGIKRLNPKLAADYEEYVMNGGPTGYTYLTNNKEYEKKMDKYLKAQMGPGAFRALSEFKQKFDDTMEAVEQIGRFAAYLTAKEQGMSIQQAVNAAKEITLNFNRKGSGKAIGLKEAAQFVTSDNKFVGAMQRFAVMLLTAPASAKLFTMFYNAQVQGLQKFGRLIKNAPAVMIPVMGGYFALGAINALIHGLWAGGDGDDDDKGYVDDYFNVPEYMRRTNIIIGVGGHDSHKYLRIPIPQELAPFYGAGDILITEMLRRTKVEPNGNPGAEIMSSLGDLLPFNAVEPFISKKNGGKGLGGGMADVIGRGIAAFSTPYSLLTNETFYGAPIYPVDKYESPEAEANKARWKEHYEKTGEAYVWIAKAINAATGGDDVRGGKINLYPEQIKFVTEDMLGGTGKFWSQVVNTTAKVIKGTTPVMDDIPFVSRIMTDTMEKNQDSHYRNLLNWYSRDVFPEMKREMDEYKRSYIAKHPEISDELDAIEAETDRLKEEYESMKGLRGKEYTERRRQINDRKDELKARDAELNDIKPEDYMPRKVLNSPEFKVWLQASEEYDIDASRFLPKEIRDLDKQIKKETDPEKIEILKQDRMLMVRDFVADLSVRYREADSK